MERFITMRSGDFFCELLEIYSGIREAAQTAAYLHVDTIKANNDFHFQHTISKLNESIDHIRNMFPDYDERYENFKKLDKDELIKEAERFFKIDI